MDKSFVSSDSVLENCLTKQGFSDCAIQGIRLNALEEPRINIYGIELTQDELNDLLEVFRKRSNTYKPHRKYH